MRSVNLLALLRSETTSTGRKPLQKLVPSGRSGGVIILSVHHVSGAEEN